MSAPNASAAAGFEVETLQDVLAGLSSKDADVRGAAAHRLNRFAAKTARRLEGSQRQQCIKQIFDSVYLLLDSKQKHDNLGGIAAILQLAKVDSASVTTGVNLHMFGRHLLKVFPPLGSDLEVIAEAASAMGILGEQSGMGAMKDKYVSMLADKALEWLEHTTVRNEAKRYGAGLILGHLARTQPSTFFPFIPRVFKAIFVVLHDAKPSVREVGGQTLRVCLEVWRGRSLYPGLYSSIETGFQKGSKDEAVHGSLIASQAFVQLTGEYVFETNYFESVCDTALKCTENRNPLVQQASLELLPLLARGRPAAFMAYHPKGGASFGSRVFDYLIKCIQKDRERIRALVTFGELTGAVKDDAAARVPVVFTAMRGILTTKKDKGSKGAKRDDVITAVCSCVSDLAKSLGPHIETDLSMAPTKAGKGPSFVDLLFAQPLSQPLLDALQSIAEHVPILARSIRRRALDMISMVLQDRPYQHPGAPPIDPDEAAMPASEPPAATRGRRVSIKPGDDHAASAAESRVANELLALQALKRMDFSSHLLTQFAADCIVPLLKSEDSEVREAAAVACAQVVVPLPRAGQPPSSASDLVDPSAVAEVLSELLDTAICDRKRGIRRMVLQSLSPQLDPFLAKMSLMQRLCACMHDSDFRVCQLAVSTLCRLAHRNPAYALPSLRRYLVSLLSGLDFLSLESSEVENAIILGQVIRDAPRLVAPYSDAVMAAILPKLEALNTNVSKHALAAMGDLAALAPGQIKAQQPHLMEVILRALRDQQGTDRREVALQVLGEVCRSAVYVVNTYTDYPELMGIFFACLTEGRTAQIRLGASRAIGILGAVAPHRYRAISLLALESLNKTRPSGPEQPDNIAQRGLSTSTPDLHPHAVGSEEYYMDIVVGEVMTMVYEPSLSNLHDHIVRCLGIMCTKAGLQAVPYLAQIVPAVLHMTRRSDSEAMRRSFHQIGKFIDIFGDHIRPFLGDIVRCIVDYWLPTAASSAGPERFTPDGLHEAVLNVLKSAVKVTGRELQGFVPALLRHIMPVFTEDDTVGRVPTMQVLQALGVIAPLLEDSCHSVVYAVMSRYADFVETPLPLRTQAVNTMAKLIGTGMLRELSYAVVHSLCRLLVFEPALRSEVLAAIRPVFDEGTGQAEMQQHRRIVENIMTELKLTEDDVPALAVVASAHITRSESRTSASMSIQDPSEMQAVAARAFNRATQTRILELAKEAGRTQNFDWPDWIRRFSLTVMKESRSVALASCQDLAMHYDVFARKMFSAAFLSCWTELSGEQRVEMTDGLVRAMQGSHLFMQMMLNAIEFMSHTTMKLKLPLTNAMLGGMALDSHAYAKALRYKEEELRTFFDQPTLYSGAAPCPVRATPEMSRVAEDLIEINEALGESLAARGVLAFVRQQSNLSKEDTIQPSWFEKLGQWDLALDAYDIQREKLDEGVEEAFQLKVRRMHCLDNLSKWQELHTLVQSAWDACETSAQRVSLALLGCSAAAGLGDWESIATYVDLLPKDDPMSAFNRALLSIHRNDMAIARREIESARTLLEPQLTTLWGESYARGYRHVVTLQLLSEMEEAITYKTGGSSDRARIRTLWEKRIEGCVEHPNVWQRILEVRSLVLAAEDDIHMHLKYASLCRKMTKDGGVESLGLDRSRRILVGLLGVDPRTQPQVDLPASNPHVLYAYIKHTWLSGYPDDALDNLFSLIDRISVPQHQDKAAAAQLSPLLARCYHKCAQWQAAPFLSQAGNVVHHMTDDRITRVIESFRCATMYDRTWYKAWHSWALMNFQAVSHFRRNGQQDPMVRHAVMSVKGFFNSIALRPKANLQDTLRLLKLLYELGQHPDVARTIAAGMSTVNVDTWLQVLPQLIARLQIADPNIRSLLHDLLLSIGRRHPQAILFPLTVAAHNKAAGPHRQDAAELLLHKIREHSNTLVEEALMVSEELIRVAVLWNEMWHEGLEEASKLSTEHDIEGMFAVLAPLHQRIAEVGREATVKETAFIQSFQKDLQEAWDWCRKYQRSNNTKDLTAAWDHYYHVYRDISKQLPLLTSLELREVSPKLLAARDLQLVVPGTYRKSSSPVYIKSFAAQLLVINSKQRPRRLTIRGSDGRDHQYLLKAHEDLRQDERVMQLFGLVNVLLKGDTATTHENPGIKQYFVLPLSPTLGLIEWVPTCDTFHSVIRDHRERNQIVLNVEVRYMLQMTPDYETLTTIQKVEVFRSALAKTPGDDLAKVLWLQSRDAETWLVRRQNYTRSLAVMSIVGYILGLGDRHPSNLMLDRRSGDVMHVDFGDCFEVATHRTKFPEKVPFRLTRMMVAAMEVSGVEGTYRSTCESVMGVMRREAESLMAVLEAFVHDPLIDWFVKVRAVTHRPWLPGDLGRRFVTYKAEYDGEHNPSSLEEGGRDNELPNSKALDIIDRVQDKLTGYDFYKDQSLSVEAQVDRLIKGATSHENLCRHYTGWCPFW